MELKIDTNFEKHYNEYRSKEEAAKTKKSLKRQIKELDQSSSSESDSEYDESYQQQFISQCDNILRQITTKGKTLLEQKTPLFEEILSVKRESDTDRPIYAKDLNRQILITSGKDSEAELANIAQSAQVDSEVLLKSTQVPELPAELLNVSEDEDFFRPSQNPSGPRFLIPAALPTESTLSEEDSDLSEMPTQSDIPSKPIKIEFNHDRRQTTVRVSKRTTRSEKRAAHKAAKEAELRDRLKRLQAVHAVEMRDRLAKALRHAPQLEGLLSVADVDDDDFNVDEWSARLSQLYDQDGDALLEETEKPVFSDDSDLEPLETGEWSDCDQEYLEEVKVENEDQKKLKKKSKKAEKNKESENSINSTNQKTKTKREFFTNLELPDTGNDRRVVAGVVRKNGSTEQFCREKHRDFGSYLKKNFDFLCEDLIRGKDETDDVLCRFKFRKVEKQDFGLDTEEIILADEKELNQWASLKKIVCLRTNAEELKDRERYARDSMQDKKHIVLASLYREESEPEHSDESQDNKEGVATTVLSKSTRKRLRKKNKTKMIETVNIDENEGELNVTKENEETTLKIEENKNAKSKDKKKDKKKSVKGALENITEESKVEEVKDEKRKKKKRKLDQDETIVNGNDENDNKNKISKVDENKSEESNGNKKEKNKKKLKLENHQNIIENVEETIKKDKTKTVSETDKKQKTKHKSKKSKMSSVPVLNANRLESLGIKPGYYKHVLMEDRNKK